MSRPPTDKKVEVFDELGREVARFTVCALDESPEVVPFTAKEAVITEGLETPHSDRIDQTSDWSVERNSSYEGRCVGWFPRPEIPPSENHVGVSVKGSVQKDNEFFKGKLSLRAASTAIAALTPGLIELSDYPVTYINPYMTQIEKSTLKGMTIWQYKT